MSLRAALEQLLGGPCYHMTEVFEHLDDHVPIWHAAIRGEAVNWDDVMGGYRAAVDWPTAACWRELAAAYPDALVLLSERDTPEQWWKSANQTIFPMMGRDGFDEPAMAQWRAMADDMLTSFEPRWADPDAAMAAYVAHNDAVRREVPEDRLVQWKPGDGWGPLCEALGVAVPDEPFPHTNTTAEFRAMSGLDTQG